VNKTEADVLRVAQSIGCERASHVHEIASLFDAKFSEALKTVGRHFDFVQLYNERDLFKEKIINLIGTDLNGFVLDDAAIDYLEQTPLTSLNRDNILDAEGIKKITDLTAAQAKLANQIQRDKEKVIKEQDVQARETILELERQLAQTEQRQLREVAAVTAREQAEAAKIQAEERLRSEKARIATEEELAIAEENKNRQIIVAQRNKEKADAVEQERVKREQELEAIERTRATELKAIDRDKAIEIERRNIQEVIKERVALEKTVVAERERIKDVEAFAGADREKQVAITRAEKAAQEVVVNRVKTAEAELASAELKAKQVIVTADAEKTAAEKQTSAKKLLAEAQAAEAAAGGLGEAKVRLALAEAVEKQGSAEAKVSAMKFQADADGIRAKADAMKLFENAGREHEEFKLRLEKEKTIELAELSMQKDVAIQQSQVVAEALRSAKIDIVGGETTFFDRITQAITVGKSIDRTVNGSQTLKDIKDTFFNGDPEYFRTQIQDLIGKFNIRSEDVKNISIAALLAKLMTKASDDATRTSLKSLIGATERFGLDGEKASTLFN
jgi:hypothetical protein